MLRFLLLILVFSMVIAVLSRNRSGSKTDNNDSAKLLPSKMEKCVYCQLHVMQEDAIKFDGQYYCSIEHQQKAEIENRQ
ncbi:MAG: hypothetical protein ACI9SC_002110 [Gammaproteobacteria bacterium]|jgi:hypothetical protein